MQFFSTLHDFLLRLIEDLLLTLDEPDGEWFVFNPNQYELDGGFTFFNTRLAATAYLEEKVAADYQAGNPPLLLGKKIAPIPAQAEEVESVALASTPSSSVATHELVTIAESRLAGSDGASLVLIDDESFAPSFLGQGLMQFRLGNDLLLHVNPSQIRSIVPISNSRSSDHWVFLIPKDGEIPGFKDCFPVEIDKHRPVDLHVQGFIGLMVKDESGQSLPAYFNAAHISSIEPIDPSCPY
jgi:hypothetical protein